MSKKEQYTPHRIYDGRKRTVFSPHPELKIELQRIHQKLWDLLICNPDFFELYRQHVVHGFVRRRQPATHAAVHQEAGSILVLDLYHAFESTDKEKVLAALERLKANLEIVKFLEENAFVGDSLPAGYPTSPLLFTAALIPMDTDLVDFAQDQDFKYSRYADDLAFSTPEDVSFIEQREIDMIGGIIENYGYDSHKIRLGHPWSQPTQLCGITVYQGELTLPRKAFRRMRGQIHRCLILEEPNPSRALSLLGHIKTIKGKTPSSLVRYELLAKALAKG